MRDGLIIFVYAAMVVAGLSSTAAAVAGYVWVDIFTPQNVAWNLGGLPVSLIMAGVCVVSWMIHPKERGRLPWTSWVQVMLALWMLTSLLWAVVPDAAAQKADWAIKTVFFVAFAPAFLRTRRDLNLLVWIIVLSGMLHCAPNGVKTIISGGGYGVALGLISANTGWGESSTLGVFAAMLIPLCIWLMRFDELLPATRWKTWGLIVCVVLIIGAVFGSYARAGLLTVLAIAAALTFLTKRRGLALLLVAGLVLAIAFGSSEWTERMSSIGDANEGSAQGRVSVWIWTLGYVAQHPLGGSFDVYRINQIERILPNGDVFFVQAKAFHSVYFETLGELGYIGCGLFLTVLIGGFVACLRERAASRRPEDVWRRELASMLACSLMGFMVGASFIGVAYQSFQYLIIGMAGVLRLMPREAPADERARGAAPLAWRRA